MKYKAVEASKIEDLNEAVNELIAEGWVPMGGVSVSLSESDDFVYFVVSQALTIKVE